MDGGLTSLVANTFALLMSIRWHMRVCWCVYFLSQEAFFHTYTIWSRNTQAALGWVLHLVWGTKYTTNRRRFGFSEVLSVAFFRACCLVGHHVDRVYYTWHGGIVDPRSSIMLRSSRLRKFHDTRVRSSQTLAGSVPVNIFVTSSVFSSDFGGQIMEYYCQ